MFAVAHLSRHLQTELSIARGIRRPFGLWKWLSLKGPEACAWSMHEECMHGQSRRSFAAPAWLNRGLLSMRAFDWPCSIAAFGASKPIFPTVGIHRPCLAGMNPVVPRNLERHHLSHETRCWAAGNSSDFQSEHIARTRLQKDGASKRPHLRILG